MEKEIDLIVAEYKARMLKKIDETFDPMIKWSIGIVIIGFTLLMSIQLF